MTELWFQKLFINEAKPALKRHSGGGGDLGIGATDIATAEEMDAILANATVANTGDTYRYTGETTDKYTQGAYYVLIGEIKLQEKEVDGNGEVTPDEGYDGLSKVTVNAPSGLKSFLDKKGNANYLFSYEEATDISDMIEYNDTSNITATANMFAGCKSLTTIPLLDTSNVTNMDNMFYHCDSLTSIPLLDTSNVTNMDNMFAGCKSLTTIPLFDTRNVTSMGYMFSECTALNTVPLFDTSNVTDMSYMLRNCSNLTTVPKFDTSNVTEMNRIFLSCSNLTTIPLLDTRNATQFYGTFEYCTNLSIVPALDMRSTDSFTSYLFNGCKNLTEIWLKNIRASIYIPEGNTTLTIESILNLLNETTYTSYSRTLTLGSANLAKLTGDYEYVKLTGKKLDYDNNEMTYTSSGKTKIPVTWCSSTDEGAMTVADYMMSKGWAIA